jgi:hypothetical protein
MGLRAFLVLSLIILISSNVFAGDRLVLLTSLDPAKNRPAMRPSSWDINKKLEAIFYDRLTPYHTSRDQLKVIHFATIEDLTRELADPENKAVFWVSHSNGAGTDGAFDKNTVVDYQGKDLTEGFQNPSSKLQYLGFVGCRADYLVQQYQNKGFLSNNENLKTYSSIKKVDARKALKYAIGNYLYHYFEKNLKASEKKCELVERKELTIKRFLPNALEEGQEITSIKILQRERLLGVFPAGNPGEVQELTVKLVPATSKKDIKLVFDSGIASAQVAMGDFEVMGVNYKAFSVGGRTLGKGRYVYNFKGELESLPDSILTKKINCID